MTRLEPNALLGKKVYDREGQLLGEVVGIAGRRGKVKAVVLRKDANVIRMPAGTIAPRLQILG
jgi:sporulation protein YlmC with PRC-barrel domain